MNHEQKLIDIKRQIEEAKLNRAKLENQKETAENAKEQLMSTLKVEYGVDSLEEAKELLVSMGQEFSSLYQQIQSSLEKIRNDSKLPH
jgi:hypothetical protein